MEPHNADYHDQRAGKAPDGPRRRSRYRFAPLVVIVALAALFFGLGLDDYVSFRALSNHRQAVQGWVEQYGVLANLGYILVYALVVTVLPPSGAVLTITSGFLFGWAGGGVTAVLGATLGAVLVYWATNTAFRGFLRERAEGAVGRMRRGFAENVWSYMFVLRLVPIFPFFVVNVGAGLLDVPFRIYLVATAIGIIPGTFVYASVGGGFGAVLDEGGRPDLSIIYQPAILGPILGFALLALVPVFYKRYRARRSSVSS